MSEMIELQTKKRQLICELLGIHPTRPNPGIGFGLYFLTPEEVHQLHAKLRASSIAMPLEEFVEAPLPSQIAWLEQVLNKAPDRASGPKFTAQLFPDKSLKSLINNKQAILSDNQYEVVKALIAKGGNAEGPELRGKSNKGHTKGTPADHILRAMVGPKGKPTKKAWIRDDGHIGFPGNRAGGGFTCSIEFMGPPLK